MISATATATEMQNNFGRYLNLVMSGQEIIVTKNGREVGRFIPRDAAVSYLSDSLTSILKGNYDLDEAKAERLNLYTKDVRLDVVLEYDSPEIHLRNNEEPQIS